jgi:predicted MFS family arabinose efflux permease
MEYRWIILAILFTIRTVMGIQFQSVASVSLFLIKDFEIDYTRIGVLIGLYHLPGVFLAFPGGLLGKRFGDKRVVMSSLVLMAIGGLIMGRSDSYTLSVIGRLLSGFGGILLNVLLTKTIADWFAGKEIITAMAILVSSWPFGISLGLVSLGKLAIILSWQFVMYLTAAICFISLALVAVLYRTPPEVRENNKTGLPRAKLSERELCLVILAGLIWMLFNVGFIVLPSFGPDLLTSIGYAVTATGSIVSMVTWISIFSVQLGGYISEKISHPNIILITCFAGISVAMLILPFCSFSIALFIWLGFIFGPPAGIIMALPAEVLQPENRAAGMGVFYTCYYGGMMAMTSLAGYSRDLTQNAAAPLLFGGICLIIAIVILVVFRTTQARIKLNIPKTEIERGT